MNKILLSSFVLLGLLFTSVSVATAKTTPVNQVNAIVGILRVLEVSESKILRIVKILEEKEEAKSVVVPATITKTNSVTNLNILGCENNNKYNVITGKFCPVYSSSAAQP